VADQKLKTALKWFFRCLVTGVVLYYLFLKIPFSEVLTALLSVKIVYLLPAFFLQVIMRYINACQLRIFTHQQKMDFSAFGLMKINLVTQFYGLLLPGELPGSIVKWYRLSKENKMRAQAAACIALSKTVNLLCLAMLGIIFFLIEMPYDSAAIAMSLIFGLIASGLIYLSIINGKVFYRVENFVNKFNLSKVPVSFQEKIGKVWNSMKRFREFPISSINYTLFLSFIYHLAGIFAIYLLMEAINIDVPAVSIIWIRAASIFIQLLPISISGLGVREGTFVFLLSNYNVSAPAAIALSFIIFGIRVVIALFGGILEAQNLFFKKSPIRK